MNDFDALYAELREIQDRQAALDEAHRNAPLSAAAEAEAGRLRRREAEIEERLQRGEHNAY